MGSGWLFRCTRGLCGWNLVCFFFILFFFSEVFCCGMMVSGSLVSCGWHTRRACRPVNLGVCGLRGAASVFFMLSLIAGGASASTHTNGSLRVLN